MSRPSLLATGFALALPVLLFGCPKKEAPPSSAGLLGEAKGRLAEREKKLAAYQLEGVVTQPVPEAGPDAGKRPPSEARFEVAYRAPGKLKGTVEVGEERHTWLFDGERLAQVSPKQKQVVEFELNRPKDEVAVYLTQIFGSIVPEGYRAPVLDLGSATARKLQHEKAPEAVALSSATPDPGGGKIEVTYVYRWPQMDLLEKRLSTGMGTMTIRVTEEHCDAQRGVCVPKKLEQSFGGKEVATTVVSRIDLGAALPADAFRITVPEGYTLSRRNLGPPGK